VLRLGDARLLRDDEDPEALAGHIRETGEDLSILADDMDSYVETLRLRHEKERGKKKQEKSASVPSRRIRIGITPGVWSPASAERRIPASP